MLLICSKWFYNFQSNYIVFSIVWRATKSLFQAFFDRSNLVLVWCCHRSCRATAHEITRARLEDRRFRSRWDLFRCQWPHLWKVVGLHRRLIRQTRFSQAISPALILPVIKHPARVVAATLGKRSMVSFKGVSGVHYSWPGHWGVLATRVLKQLLLLLRKVIIWSVLVILHWLKFVSLVPSHHLREWQSTLCETLHFGTYRPLLLFFFPSLLLLLFD